MSTIFFMAVQCCQCSTMQVKQRKNSSKSNKWTCVVCNQKQSIRMVFAQGPMAKDLRLFVQSFNMSRQFQHNSTSSSSDAPPLEDECQLEHLSPSDYKRPRTDWTEFLDPDHQISQDIERGVKPENRADCGFEPEILTDLPVRLFKKTKLKRNADAASDGGGGGGGELYKPVFSKRNSNKQIFSQGSDADKEPRIHDLTTAMDNSQWGHSKTRDDDQDSRKCQLKKGREASKWSEYITHDDDDGGANDQAGDSSNNIFLPLPNEEKIEDDEIHPDFL